MGDDSIQATPAPIRFWDYRREVNVTFPTPLLTKAEHVLEEDRIALRIGREVLNAARRAE